MSRRDTAIRFLKQSQDSQGGWGFRPGGQAFTEATAVALMNLLEVSPQREAAIRWLLKSQHRDGGWGVTANDRESGWTTAWAVAALVVTGEKEGVARGAAWLLANRSVPVKVPAAISRLDGTLRGWSWTPGTFGWVEPTALAVIALRSAAVADGGAVAAGRAMLLDRACTGGGWNYGNTTMVNNDVPPSVPETALVLLALFGTATPASEPRIGSALEYIATRGVDPAVGDLSLAWSLRALATWGINAAPLAARLAKNQGPAGDWGANPATTAIAALAMGAAGL